jgi:hypothetical protein
MSHLWVRSKVIPSEIKMWLKTHSGSAVTSYQIAPLMGKAYPRSATIEIAVNSFRKMGFSLYRATFLMKQNSLQRDSGTTINLTAKTLSYQQTFRQ